MEKSKRVDFGEDEPNESLIISERKRRGHWPRKLRPN